MPKYYYDLHIHSCLSPCGDELMTPNNILNMSMLKELDFIAITDHNHYEQLVYINQIADSYDFKLIYGTELCVKEKFHVLVYFEQLEQLKSFYHEIEPFINKEGYNQEYYGRQVLINAFEEEVGSYDHLLTRPMALSYHDTAKIIRKYDGLIVLAHIDRPNTGSLALGFDLKSADFDALEIKGDHLEIYQTHPYLEKYFVFRNSDAHDLLSIHEPINHIELEQKSVKEVFKRVKEWAN